MEEAVPWFKNLLTVMEQIKIREEYSPSEAQRLAQRIPSLHPLLHQAFLRWLKTGEVDESIEVSGYTVKRLSAVHGRQAVAASFVILSELQKDSEKGNTSSNKQEDDWIRWEVKKESNS